ncbi:hypothetical protein FJT64_006986 [Amphibalanus amphitrite]|uniref:Endonuclease/exonuclease/phosphatase domain-containing protein n=1 Tax=Amphibalanus amphitrite TaxID=1232801 RepID=A0A6A4VR86_AMPAM|nr:hypothetical protein FJT64_006986 [Amphibalanus amphitrite]
MAPKTTTDAMTPDDNSYCVGTIVHPPKSPPISIINVYAPPARWTAGQGTQRQTIQLSGIAIGTRHVVAGDFNAHGRSWDQFQPEDELGRELEDWTTQSGLVVMNDSSYIRVNPNTGGRSAPDVTLISGDMASAATWSTRPSMGSDHLPIWTTIEVNPPQHIPKRGRFNFKKADWTGFRSTLDKAMKLWSTEDDLSTHKLDTRFTQTNASNDSTWSLFADDVAILATGPSLESCAAKLQPALDTVALWARDWKVQASASKCCFTTSTLDPKECGGKVVPTLKFSGEPLRAALLAEADLPALTVRAKELAATEASRIARLPAEDRAKQLLERDPRPRLKYRAHEAWKRACAQAAEEGRPEPALPDEDALLPHKSCLRRVGQWTLREAGVWDCPAEPFLRVSPEPPWSAHQGPAATIIASAFSGVTQRIGFGLAAKALRIFPARAGEAVQF